MKSIKTHSSRRAFFLQSGAALGTGMTATTAGASPSVSGDATPLQEQLKQLRRQLDCVEDREAIRQLHLAFATLIESKRYEAAAELFDERADLHLSGVSASGKPAILRLLADEYRHQEAAVIHSAYRQKALQQRDVVTLSEDRSRAAATFHVEVELCTPLQEDCTAAKMARLQGHMADHRWEAGRFEAEYVKTQNRWKMASLRYLAS